jgi:hypothetical protein
MRTSARDEIARCIDAIRAAIYARDPRQEGWALADALDAAINVRIKLDLAESGIGRKHG